MCLIDNDVLSEAIHLREQEVDIALSDGGGGDDVAEEVGTSVVRLVAHHQRAGLHHAALQLCAHLEKKILLEIFTNQRLKYRL